MAEGGGLQEGAGGTEPARGVRGVTQASGGSVALDRREGQFSQEMGRKEETGREAGSLYGGKGDLRVLGIQGDRGGRS